ncbi:MAG: hypothetical protein IKX53_02775 [Bacteroidales bacterium]|nr:hypothetical protein [Bacteroidales bacterium]
MKKKSILILASVVVVCALGLIASQVFDWNVDTENASGNIAKSSRFSRKTATESLSNMEELIQNDASYKDGIVASYMIMQTRASQFDALVDMSNEVAGDIPEFESVLKDMNKVRPMVDNVCASLADAGKDLSTSLGGGACPDLAQNTINASLAYTTLQKQNSLANRFIAATDDYLKKAEGNDRLKLVRDQWLDYQQMTAALDGDEKSAEELQKKGHLLLPSQSITALGSFTVGKQLSLMGGAGLSHALAVDNALSNGLSGGAISEIYRVLANATDEVLASHTDELLANAGDKVLGSTQDVARLSNATGEVLANHMEELAEVAGKGLSAITGGELGLRNGITTETLGQRTSVFSLYNNPEIIRSFSEIVVRLNADGLGNGVDGKGLNLVGPALCHNMGEFIGATAAGERAELKFF